ncbi:MAG: hypothetical protein AAGB01_04320 [Cyanobacteria bacterium P01_F01_bin.42]
MFCSLRIEHTSYRVWDFYVRGVPQISFLPDEALRFLLFRKVPGLR